MQPFLLPITQCTVSGSQRPRGLGGDQTYHDIGSMPMVVFRREQNWGASFGYVRAWKGANHDVAGLQRSSRS
jgi:hypothetical protein